MKITKKSLIVIILTAVVFLSSVFLGFSAVYRIEEVFLDPITISEESKAEVDEIYQKLVKAYDKKSYFSVKEKAAREVLAAYPYFRLTEFKKSSPDTLVIKIQEDEEAYAIPTGNPEEYYILGETGVILSIRNSYKNRLEEENNVLIKGLTTISGNKGEEPTGDEVYAPLMRFCKTLSKDLGGIRRNVEGVEVELRSPLLMTRIDMREGVKIYVEDVTDIPEKKAEEAFKKYCSLNDEQKLSGRIVVTKRKDNNEVVVDYRKN